MVRWAIDPARYLEAPVYTALIVAVANALLPRVLDPSHFLPMAEYLGLPHVSDIFGSAIKPLHHLTVVVILSLKHPSVILVARRLA